MASKKGYYTIKSLTFGDRWLGVDLILRYIFFIARNILLFFSCSASFKKKLSLAPFHFLFFLLVFGMSRNRSSSSSSFFVVFLYVFHHHLILWRSSCRAEAVIVLCDETNLVPPPSAPTALTKLVPPPVAKLETLFSDANCRLPNVGAGRDLLSRVRLDALPLSAEVA